MGFGKVLSAAGTVLLVVAALVPPARAVAQPLLPDLRQAPVGCPGGYGGDPALCRDWDVCMVTDPKDPSGECVTSGSIRSVRLRFTTAEDNVGAGPLLLYGRRSPGSAEMRVRQGFQDRRGGPIPVSFDEAGRTTKTTMYYEPAKSHRHWHLLDFARMQLRTPGGRVVVADRKNGFCLGDRYRTADADSLPGAAREPGSPEAELAQRLEQNRCGYRDPDATEMVEGISVGSGDDYRYDVDFQWLDLTDVPSGTYDVVNTVNSGRTLLESSYDNNSSSISISVQWPGGAARRPSVITEAPAVTLLRSCPGQDRCSGELTLGKHTYERAQGPVAVTPRCGSAAPDQGCCCGDVPPIPPAARRGPAA
ncbi:Lysyl oxidase [Lentzea fradiae]|uniref:Lysyl oxidase n=1 Tax=Lentzea fradiae TaxID=200378 RepID=A0A1G7NM95_9PSEU|nr:lysyl oxidase family protein [Lentzea fradiae]SDF75102.1 Lysyl oxidase [Lentzea fradiae]